MEAKDLRIGNYVRLNDCVCVVNSLHEYGTARLTPIDPSINWKCESFNLKQTPNLNPIPLTKDWLVRFGFKHNIDKWFQINYFTDCKELVEEMGILINLISNRCAILDINTDEQSAMTANRIYYVHQLQNLYFALTGNELQING